MTNLSPAAQAVLDAAAKAQLGSCYTQFESIAAALRAVVHGIDYITSEEIHAIADELDDVKYGTYRSALSDKPK